MLAVGATKRDLIELIDRPTHQNSESNLNFFGFLDVENSVLLLFANTTRPDLIDLLIWRENRFANVDDLEALS